MPCLLSDRRTPADRVGRRQRLPAGQSRNLAGDGSNTVTLDQVKPRRIAPVPDGFDATSLLLMGSAIRSVETAGALETILSLCVAYAGERVAFERPIENFKLWRRKPAAGKIAATLAVFG